MRYFILFLCLMPALLEAQSFKLFKEDAKIPINRACSMYEDKSKSLSLQAIKNKNFTPLKHAPFSEVSTSNFWFKCQLQNQTQTSKWVIYNSFNWIEKLTLFEGNKVYYSGMHTPFSKRQFKVRENAFLISLKPHESKTLYFLLQSHDAFFDLFAQSLKSFEYKSRYTLLIKGLMMGIILAMLLYNFVLFISLKSRTYGYYVGYILFFALFVASDNGTLFTFVHPEWPQINSIDSFVFAGLGAMFTVLFAISFLNLKELMPRFSRFLSYYAFVVLVLSLLYALSQNHTVYFLANTLIAIAPVLLMFAGIKSLLSGFKPAWLYLVGYMSFMSSGIILALHNNHILYAPFIADWGVSFGVAVESIIFSLAIYQKLRLDQKEKERLQAVARKKDELLHLQSRMASMGEMMGHITHQWKQPLSVISVAVSTMEIELQMQSLKDEELQEKIDTIKEQIDLMNQTSRDFLNFYRPSEKARAFNVCDTIKQAVKFTEASFKHESIELSFSCPEHLLQSFGMQNELLQVFINILNNAKDALKEKNLSKKEVRIAIDFTPKEIRITIEDNAGGIDEAILDKIFEQFFTTKSEKGTGLGLYMSKQIVENMKGSLSAQNGTMGAQFIVRLLRYE